MSDIDIGRKAKTLRVNITPGEPFIVVMRRFRGKSREDATPVEWTSAPTLEFPEAGVAPWVATISGHEATFAISPDRVDSLLATRRVRTLLTTGGITLAVGAWRSAL